VAGGYEGVAGLDSGCEGGWVVVEAWIIVRLSMISAW
jgi:hypothetical protein